MPANFIPDRLTDLPGDVNIATPVDQNKLIYDASTGKWVNQPDPDIKSGQTDPTTGLYNGYLFLNTTTLVLKFYYGGNWYTITTLTQGDYLVFENGDGFLMEDGSGVLALDPM